MNKATIVRWEADTIGVHIRLWVDDEEDRHVCVAEISLEESALIAFARAVAAEQNRGAQHMLHFDN